MQNKILNSLAFFLKKVLLCLAFLLFISKGNSQNPPAKQIEIVYAGTLAIDQNKFPGATIFNSDKQQQVQFRHEGLEVWCDIAVLYQENNLVKAYGNIFLQQGDSLKMNSGYIEYNGDTKIAISKEQVKLRNEEMLLETEELIFDRNTQQAYYMNYGKITDKDNVLTSKEGRYFVQQKKNKFLTNVQITNPDFVVSSSMLDFYHPSGNLYLFGATTIKGKNYKIYTEKGFYNTKNERGYFIQNPKIWYDNKKIQGDSLYFDNKKQFASATNHIKITDSINKTLIKGHYGEVHKLQDSMFITKKALVISEIEKDSAYIHGKKILVTGKAGNRIIRAFPNARMYKTDMQGKCDSIHGEEFLGLTKLLGKPVLWNGQNQLTGDTIHIKANTKNQQPDSLKVFNNAFVVEKDTLGTGFNQVKGKVLYGKFSKNKLKKIDLLQNTEVIYYAYDDQKNLTGINKTKCSRIQVRLDEAQKMDEISFYQNVEGKIYPEEKLPVNERKFPEFVWRGEEIIRSKEEIFPEEEKNITLKKIQPMKSEEEIDALELESETDTSEVPLKINK